MKKGTMASWGVALALACTVGSASAAMADDSSPMCGDVACPAPSNPAQPQSGPSVAATTATPPVTAHSEGLAFTGADIAGTTIFALGAVAAGSALVYSSRRARRSAVEG